LRSGLIFMDHTTFLDFSGKQYTPVYYSQPNKKVIVSKVANPQIPKGFFQPKT
jgi:hypothetical protein